MLAEIAAANLAFNVIKQALANGKELHQLGSRVFDYFDNKAKIQEKATQKGGGSDLEEFMALEQLKQQEEELRERMIYAGRPGMWTDWLKFQAAAARRRRETAEALAREEALRQERLEEMIENIAAGMGFVVLFALMAYGVVAYFKYIR
jgi:chromatin segregation and condensation protein Rec8/ScpA/Scc1 (kleisin family)